MNRLRFAVLALVLLVAAPAFAQTTIAGDWDMTINSPQGSNTVKVTFKQDGEKVDGLFKSPQGELPFTGTLAGDELKFTFSIPFQGQPLEIAMTGKANFGGMAEGDWTAKRAEATTTAAAPPAAAAASSTAASSGGGLAGKWDVTFITPGGEFPANATFTDEGGKISGTFGSQMGEAPITGTVEGRTFKLTMTAQTPQGSMEVALTGEVDGDSIKGKAEIAGMGQMEWSAKRLKP